MKTFNDIIEKINWIKDCWDRCSLIKEKWEGCKYLLELHTGGLSNNEKLMKTIIDSEFHNLFWKRIDRGGHYYYEIDLRQLEYLPSSQYCKQMGFSRQNLNQNKEKYDIVFISPKKLFVKPINRINLKGD